MTVWIGIDPGLDGAIAALDESGAFVGVWDMPTAGTKPRRVDPEALRCVLSEATLGGPARAAVEDVHAMPKQGVTSVFSFGHALGSLHAVLVCAGVPFEVVRPQVWQREFCGLGRGDKERSRMAARRMWPDAPLGRKKDHGRAEALLIAEWLRRRCVADARATNHRGAA